MVPFTCYTTYISIDRKMVTVAIARTHEDAVNWIVDFIPQILLNKDSREEENPFRGVFVQWIRHFSVFFSQNFFSLTMFINPEKHGFQCFATLTNHSPAI